MNEGEDERIRAGSIAGLVVLDIMVSIPVALFMLLGRGHDPWTGRSYGLNGDAGRDFWVAAAILVGMQVALLVLGERRRSTALGTLGFVGLLLALGIVGALH